MSDPEDLLSESLQTLYDYTPVAHSSAGSLFTYRYPRDLPSHLSAKAAAPIELQTPDTQPANWVLHASSIWMSSLFIADHLEDLGLDRHLHRAQGLRVPLRILELGAGAGLPSIVIARLYDRVQVVSSDYPDEELIRTLVDNIQRNGVPGNCRVVPYAWGSDPSALFTPHGAESSEMSGFDVVIAADTLWNPDLHDVFTQTLCMTLRRSSDARIYLVAGLHTGRYTIQSFLRTLIGAGLEVEEATERDVGGSGRRAWGVERADGETEQDRRRWVIWMVLRWSSDRIA